jgi:Fe2+ or Zn2+ uptake regulation protein
MSALRNTPQRSLVYGLMRDNHTHPTADEVYMMAREKDPRISRGTVYRNLNLLADTGRIRKVTSPEGPDHYDCLCEEHYHFLCLGCGKMFDTRLPYDDSLDRTPEDLDGFQVQRHRLLLEGLCPACVDARRSEEER